MKKVFDLKQSGRAKTYNNLLKKTDLPQSPVIHELEPAEMAGSFHAAISDSKANNPWGSAVYVYDQADYADMRLFQSPDGKSGFAIKPDGDIVSVYSPGGGHVYSMLQLAVEQGGTKLDAFDTVLPEIYGQAGFKEVRREPWNEEHIPEGWDKEQYSRYNGGEPDVVYMEYDPDYTLEEVVEPVKKDNQTRDWQDRALDKRDDKNFEVALRFMDEHGVQEINQGTTPPKGRHSYMILPDGRIRAWMPWSGKGGEEGLSQKTFGMKVTLRALRDWMGY